MGFMEILGLIGIAFAVALLVFAVIQLMKRQKLLKSTEYKFRLKYTNVWLNYFWIVLSVINTLTTFAQSKHIADNGDVSRADGYFYICIFWTITGVIYLLNLIFNRYAYVSEQGIIILGIIKTEDCKYEVSGDIVEIYNKSSTTPLKYRIFENKDEVVKILDDNYTPYIGGKVL